MLSVPAGSDNRQAFEGIYRDHVGRVYALCVRMVGDRGAAEELTQDVFVRAWEKLTLFRGESAFSTWLHRLAVNVVLHRRKTEGIRRARFTSDEDPDVVVAGGGAHVPGDERRLPGALPRRVPGADDEHAHGAQPPTAPVRPGAASGAVPDVGPDAVPGTVLDGVGAAIMVPPYRRGHGRGAPGTAPGRE